MTEVEICLTVVIGAVVPCCAWLYKQNASLRQEVNRKEGVIQRKQKSLYSKQQEVEFHKTGKHVAESKAARVVVETDANVSDGYFSKKAVITYKARLYVGEIPWGEPIVLNRLKYRQVDIQNVNKVLDDFAKPLLDAGLQVGVRYLAT